MTTKEQLKKLNSLGFSNGFISKKTGISPTRVYNAGGDRKVSLTDDEVARIDGVYKLGVEFDKWGDE